MVISEAQLSKTKERLYWNVIRGIAIYLMLWGTLYPILRDG